MFKKTFKAHGTFSAFNDATEWLTERGYSCGSMQRDEPIGVKKGEFSIAKWRHLEDGERFLLDGVLRSDDFREGDVSLMLTNFFEDKEDFDRDMSLEMAKDEMRNLL